jgi:hypothetical protein
MAHPDTRRSNMPMTDATRRFAHRAGPWVRGPELVFGATLLIAFVAMAAGTKMLASDLVLPAASTLFFVLAGLVALIAACGRRSAEPAPVTYWDVAGALTMFGICVASQIDPDEMARLVTGARRDD